MQAPQSPFRTRLITQVVVGRRYLQRTYTTNGHRPEGRAFTRARYLAQVHNIRIAFRAYVGCFGDVSILMLSQEAAVRLQKLKSWR